MYHKYQELENDPRFTTLDDFKPKIVTRSDRVRAEYSEERKALLEEAGEDQEKIAKAKEGGITPPTKREVIEKLKKQRDRKLEKIKEEYGTQEEKAVAERNARAFRQRAVNALKREMLFTGDIIDERLSRLKAVGKKLTANGYMSESDLLMLYNANDINTEIRALRVKQNTDNANKFN